MVSHNSHPYWWTYIVECKDGTYYTGLTYDLDNRLKTHNSGKGATYTRGRRPVTLIYSEKFSTHKEAVQRECFIKKLRRQDKKILVHSK